MQVHCNSYDGEYYQQCDYQQCDVRDFDTCTHAYDITNYMIYNRILTRNINDKWRGYDTVIYDMIGYMNDMKRRNMQYREQLRKCL